MRWFLFVLFAFLIYETVAPMTLPHLTDCYNKGFICYDADRFYQCVDVGNKTVTMGEPQFCPRGLKCNDNDEMECGEPWPEEDFVGASVVTSTTVNSNIQTDGFEKTSDIGNTVTDNNKATVQYSTGQFLIVDDIQTEIISITERENLETEFNKLAVTTNSGTETLLENTEFSANEKTDEFLFRWPESWKSEPSGTESGESKETHTTEDERAATNNMTDAPEDADYEYIYDFLNEAVEEANSSTSNYDLLTVNDEKEFTDATTFNVVPFSTEVDDVTTRLEVFKTTTESSHISTEDPTDYSHLQSLDFTTEQNEIFVTTEKSETSEIFADDDQTTVTQTTTGNNLSSLAAEVEESTILYYSDIRLPVEALEFKEQIAGTEGGSTEAFTSLKEYAVTNNHETAQEFTTSVLNQTHALVETGVTSDTGLLEESQEKTEESTISTISSEEFNFISSYNLKEEIAFTQTESTTTERETEKNIDELALTDRDQNTQVLGVTEEEVSPAIVDFIEENTTEAIIRPTVDTIGKSELQSGESTLGIFTEESVTTQVNILPDEISTSSMETNSVVDESNSEEISTESLHLESEGLSSIQEILDVADTSTSATNFEENTSTITEEIYATEVVDAEYLHIKSDVFSSTQTNLYTTDISSLATNLEDITGTSTINEETNTTEEIDTESLVLEFEGFNSIQEDLYGTDISTIATNVEDHTGSSTINKEVNTTEDIDTESLQLESEIFSFLQDNLYTTDIPTIATNLEDNIGISTIYEEINTTEEIDTESLHLESEIFSSIEDTLYSTNIPTIATNLEDNTGSSTTDKEIEEIDTESLHLESETFSSIQDNLYSTDTPTNATNFEETTGSSTTDKEIEEMGTESLHFESERFSSIQDNLYSTDIPTVATNHEDNTASSTTIEDINTESFHTESVEVSSIQEDLYVADILTSATNFEDNTGSSDLDSTTSEVLAIKEIDKNLTTPDTLISEARIFASTTDTILEEETTTSSPEGQIYLTQSAQPEVTTISVDASSGIESFYDNELISTEPESAFSTTNDEVSTNHEVSYTIAPASLFTCPSVGKFPDPESCSKFYLCFNAFDKYIELALDCPKGTLFDSILKECTRRPVQCPGEIALTCLTSGVNPHPTDCSRYYKCLWLSFSRNFILKQFRCPRGTRYHTNKRRCERTTAAECVNSFVREIADSTSFKCVEVGRFAVEENCRDYYECKKRNGEMTSRRKSCSESKLFDAEWGRCRKSHLVACPFGDYDSRESSEIDDRSVEYG